jgi:hypothetical protein
MPYRPSTDTLIHIALSIVTGVICLAAIAAAAAFGGKLLLKLVLPQLDLDRELQQGNRAVALFGGLLLAGTVIALALVVIAIYNQAWR